MAAGIRVRLSCRAGGSEREERNVLPFQPVRGLRALVAIEDEEGHQLLQVPVFSWAIGFGWCLSQQQAALSLPPVLHLSLG